MKSINEYVNTIISIKRYDILNEANIISIYARFMEFKKLYKKAISTKNINDINKALKFYKQFDYEFTKVTSIDHKVKDMVKELDNILKEIEHQNDQKDKKKITVSEIKRHLMVIIRKYNSDPEIIARLKEEEASKFVCNIFDESDNSVTFWVVKVGQEQEITIAISDIISDMAEELEKSFNYGDIFCDTGDGDEGCIYVYF